MDDLLTEDDDRDGDGDLCSVGSDSGCSGDMDMDMDGPPHKRSKLSRELPTEAIDVFKKWMLSEKNFAHPVSHSMHASELILVFTSS
jgi:hypothetical protein